MRFRLHFLVALAVASPIIFLTPSTAQVASEERARAYYFEAEAALGDGRLSEAERYHDEAVDLLGASNAKLASLHVRILFAAERYEEAKTALEQFYSYNPGPNLKRETAPLMVRIDDRLAVQRAEKEAKAAARRRQAAFDRHINPVRPALANFLRAFSISGDERAGSRGYRTKREYRYLPEIDITLGETGCLFEISTTTHEYLHRYKLRRKVESRAKFSVPLDSVLGVEMSPFSASFSVISPHGKREIGSGFINGKRTNALYTINIMDDSWNNDRVEYDQAALRRIVDAFATACDIKTRVST